MTAPFTAAAVAAVGATLTPARCRHLVRCRGGRYVPEGDLGPGVALVLWLADALAQHSPLPPDQQDLLLDELGDAVAGYGRRLWGVLEPYEREGTRADLPTGALVVWDRHLASASGRDGFLDVRKGGWLDELPHAPLLVESLDLATLFTRYRARLVRGHDRRQRPEDDGGRRLPADRPPPGPPVA